MTTAPLNYKEILLAGQELFRAQDFEGALSTFSQVEEDDPMLFAQALAWSGRSLCRLERYEEGLSDLARSIKICTAPMPLYYMGEALYRMGNTDASLECLEQAVAADDKLTDAYIMMGTIQRMQGKPHEAIKSLDMALRNDPKALAARFQLAQCEYDVGDLQRATSQAYMIVQQKEDYGPIHLLLGHCTLRLNDYRQAAYEYCRALALLTPTTEIYEGLGRAFANLKDFAQALKAFEGVLLLDPDQEMSLVAAARIAERMKETDKAVKLWTSAARFPKYAKMAVQALTKLGAEIPELPEELPSGELPKAPEKKRSRSKPAPRKAAAGAASSDDLPRDFEAPPQIDRATLPLRNAGHSAPTAPLTTHAAGTLSLSSRQAPEKGRTRPLPQPAFAPEPEPASPAQRLTGAFDAMIRPYADIFSAFLTKMQKSEAKPAEVKPKKEVAAKRPVAPIDETIAEVLAKRRHEAPGKGDEEL